MADSLCRVLRDGALEGELAPALTIKDSILSPLGLHIFDHVLYQLSSFILAGKSQSRCFFSSLERHRITYFSMLCYFRLLNSFGTVAEGWCLLHFLGAHRIMLLC